MVSSTFVRRLTALLGLSAVWLFLLCTPVLAHARLLETDPTSGASLSQIPERVQLRFNEPIDAEFSPLRVFDPQGNRMDRDNARVAPDDRRVLTADLKELPEGSGTGVYTVEWRVTSVDGHPVSGSYGFTVTEADTNESQSAAQADGEDVGESGEQPSDRAESGSEGQQDTDGGLGHTIHFVGLGLGALVVLVLALLQRTKAKRSS